VLFIIGKEWGLYLVSATEPDAEPVLLREGQHFFSRRAWSPDGRHVGRQMATTSSIGRHMGATS
jgi:hypothetical protein